MKKRRFLQALVAGGAVSLVSTRSLQSRLNENRLLVTQDPNSTIVPVIDPPPVESPSGLIIDQTPPEPAAIILEETVLEEGFKHTERDVDLNDLEDKEIDEYLAKIRNFDADFSNDIYLPEEKRELLVNTISRLERVQNYVGHGNFNLIGFDEMLFFARNYEAIGAFEKSEMDFLEEIFFADANEYGFFGEKVTPELTTRIPIPDVVKIHGSGHYLLRGSSYNLYQQIKRDVGQQLLLTSGIRNVVKQMHLFLAKTLQSELNLSKASRSLAPPGHSFHCIGDFDVGKIGLGELNFTEDFSHTEEFRRMVNLGYIDIRYTDTNLYGVRYEPWHIKIA
jgi:D-alanyl-D-alanine carboxypeptidase